MKQASAALARARARELLSERLEAALSSLYRPALSKSGNVATRRGVPVYNDPDLIDFAGRLLGESVSPETILDARTGREIPIRVRAVLDKFLERIEFGELHVEREVRLEDFRRYARSSIDFWKFHGVARDGRWSISESLEFWSWTRGVVDLELLEEAERLEEATRLELHVPEEVIAPAVETPFGDYLLRVEKLRESVGEIPWSLRCYILDDGLIFDRSSSYPSSENADRVLEAAFVARLEREEAKL